MTSHKPPSILSAIVILAAALSCSHSHAGLKTWDGKHSIDQIEVSVVYFVPRDRVPLADWKDRVNYFCRRIERFHEREFHTQSKLTTVMHPEPFRSARSMSQLRDGDADFIFFQTLREVDSTLQFGEGERKSFPILLVLSDVNWRPLDDFFRTKPGEDGRFEFEGNYSGGRHFPGAAAGGARATYLSQRGVGWGLVSADGWRVPYCGSDCVVYHEGVGHAIGLPHPEPGNNSVMSLGQYHGWISQSWLDDAQKLRLGWTPPEAKSDRATDLFSSFTAIPVPNVPKPDEPVRLNFNWPDEAKLSKLRIRFQTDLRGPWIEATPAETRHPVSTRHPLSTRHPREGGDPAIVDTPANATPPANAARPANATRPASTRHPREGGDPALVDTPVNATQQVFTAPTSILLGQFDRACPVAYRVDAVLDDGRDVELWGYFQVREHADNHPQPVSMTAETGGAISQPAVNRPAPSDAVNLLELIDVEKDQVSGTWLRDKAALESSKGYGTRIEIPYQPPEEYELVVIVEPLDEPNGLILGQRSGERRCLVLVNFDSGQGTKLSAIENIDGKNVGSNPTSVQRPVLVKDRLSQIVCTVRKKSITVTCDGQELINWQGDSSQLSLSDYWKTPNENTLFLGTYDCRYRFHRVTLSALSGEGKKRR